MMKTISVSLILQIRQGKLVLQGKLVFGKSMVIDQLVIKLGPESRHLYISPGF